MNREKAQFGLEDDPLYILMRKICIDDGDTISGTAAEIHARLSPLDKDFERQHKNSISLGKRIHNVLEELGNEFDIKIVEGRGHTVKYTISARRPEE